jgi:hypothetical protein
MKRLWTLLAAVVFACAWTPRCDAAQAALSLDGNEENFVEVADNPNGSLDAKIGSNLTMEAWIYPTTDEDPAENHASSYMILNKEAAYEMARRVGLSFMCAIQAQDGNTWNWADSQVPLPMNQWAHVAVTYDGLLIRLFVNGKFAKSDDQYPGPDGAKGVIPDNDRTFRIGAREDNPAQKFIGLIDEVRISNSLRYTEAGYTVPAVPFEPDANTMALYHLDEVAGNVVKDASTNGNNGTLMGAAKLVAVTNGPFKDVAP